MVKENAKRNVAERITALALLISVLISVALILGSCAPAIQYAEIRVEGYDKIVVLLDREAAPKTVDNFVKLVKSGFYDGLTFHRIQDGFVMQGGDPDADGSGGSPNKIYGEFKENGWEGNYRSHYRGAISMARSNGMNTASSQFFICLDDARQSLDDKYACFGEVVEGMDVVDQIVSDYKQYATGGMGSISSKANQPKIEYIKMLTDYQR